MKPERDVMVGMGGGTRCQACGHPVQPGTGFCTSCGQPVAAAVGASPAPSPTVTMQGQPGSYAPDHTQLDYPRQDYPRQDYPQQGYWQQGFAPQGYEQDYQQDYQQGYPPPPSSDSRLPWPP